MPLYSDHYIIPFLTVIRMSTVRIYYNSCWTMWSQINWKRSLSVLTAIFLS